MRGGGGGGDRSAEEAKWRPHYSPMGSRTLRFVLGLLIVGVLDLRPSTISMSLGGVMGAESVLESASGSGAALFGVSDVGSINGGRAAVGVSCSGYQCLTSAGDVPLSYEEEYQLKYVVPPASGNERFVRAASIVIGYTLDAADYEKRMEEAVDLVEQAASRGANLVVLPEAFCGPSAETIPGRTTQVFMRIAAKHRMYVVVPIREQSEQGVLSSVALIDRAGQLAGIYRKLYPCSNCGDSGILPPPWPSTIPTFDTDFGRLAILMCFDAYFPELWMMAEAAGAQFVVWPSMFPGKKMMQSYATIHNYVVLSNGDGSVIDASGELLPAERYNDGKVVMSTVDMDKVILDLGDPLPELSGLSGILQHYSGVEVERVDVDSNLQVVSGQTKESPHWCVCVIFARVAYTDLKI